MILEVLVAPHRLMHSAELQCLETMHHRRRQLEQLQLKRSCQRRNHRSQTMAGRT